MRFLRCIVQQFDQPPASLAEKSHIAQDTLGDIDSEGAIQSLETHHKLAEGHHELMCALEQSSWQRVKQVDGEIAF